MNEDAKSAVTQREKQVQEQMNLLNSSLDRLSGVVEKLEDSIKPILADQPPVEQTGKDELGLVPLATFIRQSRRNVSRIGDQVHSMLDRLEL